MSDISDIFDQVVSVVSATLNNYDKLANPYIVEENANNLFNKAFGVAYAPGLNTQRLTKPKISIERQIDVLLINKVTSSESNFLFSSDQQKAILEDQFAIIKAIRTDGMLSDLSKNDFASDAGIEFIDAAQAKYYLLNTTFAFEYFETN